MNQLASERANQLNQYIGTVEFSANDQSTTTHEIFTFGKMVEPQFQAELFVRSDVFILKSFVCQNDALQKRPQSILQIMRRKTSN